MKACLHEGFTFIELMVTVGLTMFLFYGIAASYTQFTDDSRLRQAALTFKNDLRFAQSKATSGQKPINIACDELTGYQVSFTAGTYSVQAQCNPVQSLAPVITVTFANAVTFYPVPSRSLTFGVLTRGVNIDSAAAFTLVRGNRKYLITVTPQGDIIDGGLQ